MQILTTLEQFENNSKQYNLVPVCACTVGDKETPVALYEKLVGEKVGFLLESAEANKHFGRYSFIGFNPLFELKAFKNKCLLSYENGETKEIHKAPVDALKEVMQSYRAPQIEGLPPFCGGMMGYLAFEIVGTWEKIRHMQIDEDDVLAQTMLCKDVVILDHLNHKLYFITWNNIKSESPKEVVEELFKDACVRLQASVRALNKSNDYSSSKGIFASAVIHQPDFSLHEENIAKIQQYILEGDTYQTVLSMPFKRLLPVHSLLIYRRLRRDNPSPYMFYLNFGEKKLVGASPEMLVRVQNGEVKTFPIAGTRPRGEIIAEDKYFADELLKDKKEVAEHSMLVDLGRNDVGKVSKPGTVHVTRFKEIEYFSHVMHMVSEVTGQLEDGYDAFDALKACFPAGTVSGAPKIRSMEIIAELEKTKRGVYAGAVGYWDFNGNMDTCIAIRTMSIDGNVATVQGGGGIVADSVAKSEVAEVQQKTKVLINLLEDTKDYAYFN